MKKENIFVFDVESIGLHGAGFAVGATVINKKSKLEMDRFSLVSEEGIDLCNNEWVKQNVFPKIANLPKCKTLVELRDKFYAFYCKHRDTCEIWSDVNFPVETNFLSAVVNDDIKNREWNMPYPLFDISSQIDVSISRIKNCGIEELQEHNPLHDAIASAYLYLKLRQ